MRASSDGRRSSHGDDTSANSTLRRNRSHRTSFSRLSSPPTDLRTLRPLFADRSSQRYSRTSFAGGRHVRGTENQQERIQVIDDGVDRTPKPLSGVKTAIASTWVTDQSKGSTTSGFSDNVLDRMSCMSYDAPTMPGSGTQSPIVAEGTIKPILRRGDPIFESSRECLSEETPPLTILREGEEATLFPTDLEKTVDVTLGASELLCILDAPGLCVEAEGKVAESVLRENGRYEAMLKRKQAASERFVDADSQTIHPLCKNQETQTEPFSTATRATQVTLWEMHDGWCETQDRTCPLHSDVEVLTQLRDNLERSPVKDAENGVYLAPSREVDREKNGDRMSSFSFVSQSFSARESVVSTASFATSIETGLPSEAQLPSQSGSAVDQAEVGVRGIDPLSQMAGLEDALRLMDALTTQERYRKELLAYRGMQHELSQLPKSIEADEASSVGEGSVISSRRAPFRLSARQSRLLSSASQSKLETASDDHDAVSLATDVEGRSASSMPKLHHLWEWKRATSSLLSAVTCVAWKPGRPDLLAVGYGSLRFAPASFSGCVAFWSLKHPEQPQWSFLTAQGVTAIQFSRQQPHLLVVGLYSGSIALYDVQGRFAKQLMHSAASPGRHTEPVWQLEWRTTEEEREVLISVGGDGRVVQWCLSKGLEHEDLMKLRCQSRKKSLEASEPSKAPFISRLAIGFCLALSHDDTDLYLVGTEQGAIHKCSVAYTEQYLDTYLGHLGPVYAVRWSPFRPDLFLSCGADWTVQLWLSHRSSAVLTFHTTKEAIADLQWCPRHATIFACLTVGGKVEVWDISISTLKPISCYMFPGCQLTKLAFHSSAHVLVCGDDKGCVSVLHLVNIVQKGSSEVDQRQQLSQILNANIKD